PRMAEILPDARLFVILREPIDRAISAYRFFTELFEGMTFAEACRGTNNLVSIGFYARHLERVFTYYSREQVKILFYEDVQTSPNKVLAELLTFLGASSTFVPTALNRVYNSSHTPLARKALNMIGLRWALGYIKGTPVGRWV